MGMCELERDGIDGTKSFSEVMAMVREWQEEDRAAAAADSDGYTGGWDTIGGVRRYCFSGEGSRVFEDRDAAEDWVLDNAAKREAIAVKYKDAKGAAKWFVGGWAAC